MSTKRPEKPADDAGGPRLPARPDHRPADVAWSVGGDRTGGSRKGSPEGSPPQQAAPGL